MADNIQNQTFIWPVRVYYEDTDAQGLVYYANYFRFMERARTEWLRAFGVEQDKLMHEDRRVFVVVDTQAAFLAPARFNDELLVSARLLGRARASFELEQLITRKNGDLLIKGKTRAAFLNADTMKPARLPTDFFKELSS